MKRLEDKYNGELAMAIAESLLKNNQRTVAEYMENNSVEVLERAFRSGYTQALEDYGIEVYPKNITQIVTETIEED